MRFYDASAAGNVYSFHFFSAKVAPKLVSIVLQGTGLALKIINASSPMSELPCDGEDMESSEQAHSHAEQQRAEAEQKLVEDTDGSSAEGFDRARQGAPRGDDSVKYSGQSGYGGLEKPAGDELADSSHSRRSAGQEGDFGEGNYGGERGQAGRGGLSSYGNSSGSRYLVDSEVDTSSRTQTPKNASVGLELGRSVNPEFSGRPSGEHDDQETPRKSGGGSDQSDLPGRSGVFAEESETSDSDRRIHEQIAQRLLAAGDEVRDVSVVVQRGMVSLNGSVPERSVKESIEAIADNLDGVVKVDNQIEVRRNADQSATYDAGDLLDRPVSQAASPTTQSNAGPTTFGAASGKAEMEKQQKKQDRSESPNDATEAGAGK